MLCSYIYRFASENLKGFRSFATYSPESHHKFEFLVSAHAKCLQEYRSMFAGVGLVCATDEAETSWGGGGGVQTCVGDW